MVVSLLLLLGTSMPALSQEVTIESLTSEATQVRSEMAGLVLALRAIEDPGSAPRSSERLQQEQQVIHDRFVRQVRKLEVIFRKAAVLDGVAEGSGVSLGNILSGLDPALLQQCVVSRYRESTNISNGVAVGCGTVVAFLAVLASLINGSPELKAQGDAGALGLGVFVGVAAAFVVWAISQSFQDDQAVVVSGEFASSQRLVSAGEFAVFSGEAQREVVEASLPFEDLYWMLSRLVASGRYERLCGALLTASAE